MDGQAHHRRNAKRNYYRRCVKEKAAKREDTTMELRQKDLLLTLRLLHAACHAFEVRLLNSFGCQQSGGCEMHARIALFLYCGSMPQLQEL